jgi:surfeit locus 1 family protein
VSVQCNQIDPALPDPTMDPSREPARRHRPRYLPTAAAIVAVALFLTAGEWQRGRMEQKAALRAQFDAASASAPAELPRYMGDGAAWRYRPVRATGTFDAAHQILIDNKVQDGRTGFHVVTPLALPDGRVLLVDRGWIAAGASRAQLPVAPPPGGSVTVTGRINTPTAAYVELQRGAPAGVLWQNLDPARVAQATGLAVLPVVLEQTTPLDASDALVRAWPEPDFGIERHRIYMMQWYLFAATAAGLWLVFNVRRRRGPSNV